MPRDNQEEQGDEQNKGGENQEKPNEGEQTPSGNKEDEKNPDEEKKPTKPSEEQNPEPSVKYPTSIAELNKSENAEYKNHLVEYFDDVFKETLVEYGTGGEATVQNTTSLAYDINVDNSTITGFFKMKNEEKTRYFITSGKIKGEISLEEILKYKETNENNPNLSIDKLSVSTSYSLVMAAKENNYQAHAKQAYEFLTDTTLNEANYFAEIVGTGTALGGNHATFRTVAMYEKDGKIYIHAITTQVKNDRYNELGVADDVEIYVQHNDTQEFGCENTIILMTFEKQHEKEMGE